MSAVLEMRRLLETRPQPPGERCGFCDASAGVHHGHVVDVEKRALLCTCRPCYLLFTNSGAAGGRYRAVPENYRRAPELAPDDTQWDDFQIPVGIAFFFRHSSLDRTVALYPSPAGAMESALPISAGPTLDSLAPDVEALLVSRLGGRNDAFIVPIDACYALVGRIRRHWRGFDGGEDAKREIDAFFEDVRRRAA